MVQTSHWSDHAPAILAVSTAVWGVVSAAYLLLRRCIRRARARSHALFVLLEAAVQELADKPAEADPVDIAQDRAVHHSQVVEARRRMRLAYGKRPGAPSRTLKVTESDDT